MPPYLKVNQILRAITHFKTNSAPKQENTLSLVWVFTGTQTVVLDGARKMHLIVTAQLQPKMKFVRPHN
jgi:hypothetical protein